MIINNGKNSKRKSRIITQKDVQSLNKKLNFDSARFGKILKNGVYDIELFDENFTYKTIIENFITKLNPENQTENTTILENNIPDSLNREDFEYIKVIGKHHFGKIIQVRYKKNGKVYSMKTIKKSKVNTQKYIEHIQAERQILEEIIHPFVTKLHFAFQTPKKLYLLTDLYKEGDLYYYIQKSGHFSEEIAKFYFSQIVLFFDYLHSKDIVYRNLSPENIYLDETGYIKIINFSISKLNIHDYTGETKTFCGIPEYCSPEMINEHKYGKCVDVWCLGILLYEMLFGETPFKDENLNQLYKKIIFNSPDFTLNKIGISFLAMDLISRMLEKNPEKRPTIRDIQNDPFLEDINFGDIYQKKVIAPIIPDKQGEKDFDYIDPEILQENPEDSIANGCTPILKENFEDFQFLDSVKSI